jgi:hypothetical protein
MQFTTCVAEILFSQWKGSNIEMAQASTWTSQGSKINLSKLVILQMDLYGEPTLC